jgi:hypothetical protein
MRDSVDLLGNRFRQAGAASQFRGAFYDEPHHWTTAMQDEAFEWLDRHLKS